jgi:hypothetical protein
MANFIEGLGANSRYTKQKTTKKTSPTNSLTKQIITYLDEIGWASRINVVAIQRNGKFTISNMKLGIPDIIACVGGRFLGIEIKTGKDKLSDKQIKCHSYIRDRGEGSVFVVSDFNNFLTQFEQWK